MRKKFNLPTEPTVPTRPWFTLNVHQKMKAAVFLFLSVAFVSLSRGDEKAEHVTLQQLLDTPATYHGHRVIVRGVWDYGFETSVLFDGKNETKAIWVEVERQDVAKPKDKKLLLLQQLFQMRRETDATPAINVGVIEVEFAGIFFDWPSMPETKAELKKVKAGEYFMGGFGHLDAYQQKIVVEQVRWFRSTVESRKPETEKKAANQPSEPAAPSGRGSP